MMERELKTQFHSEAEPFESNWYVFIDAGGIWYVPCATRVYETSMWFVTLVDAQYAKSFATEKTKLIPEDIPYICDQIAFVEMRNYIAKTAS